MDLYAILDQVVALLQQRGRLTYRALQYQFSLDDTGLAALKEELLFAYPQVVEEEGRGLVWREQMEGSGTASPLPSPTPSSDPPLSLAECTVPDAEQYLCLDSGDSAARG